MYPKYFATGNKHKLSEINQILGEELEQIEIDLLEPQGVDVVEIAKIKAEDAFRKTGKPVLVEDTSLEFKAWGALPGPLIKWFVDSIGNEGILKTLSSETDRRVVAKTVLAFYDGTTHHTFLGEISGMIPEEIRGSSDFGWDPIFIPGEHSKSFAEMAKEEKNSLSMRRLATLKLKEFIQ